MEVCKWQECIVTCRRGECVGFEDFVVDFLAGFFLNDRLVFQSSVC